MATDSEQRSLRGGPLDGLRPRAHSGSTTWRWLDAHGQAWRGPAECRWLYRYDDALGAWVFAGHQLDAVCREHRQCEGGCDIYPDPALGGAYPDECPLCGWPTWERG